MMENLREDNRRVRFSINDHVICHEEMRQGRRVAIGGKKKKKSKQKEKNGEMTFSWNRTRKFLF